MSSPQPVYRIILVFLLLLQGCANTRPGGMSPGEGTSEELLPAGADICQDGSTGRMWQQNKGGLLSSGREAEQYADGLRLGGYDDWRLPTSQELRGLHFMLYWQKDRQCPIDGSGEYWSVNTNGIPEPGHWETHHLCSPEYRYIKANSSRGYVRAVRP